MANYLNDLTKGLVTGLQGIAGGIVEKSWRNNAEELFKQGQNYLTEIAGQYKNYISEGEKILKSVDPSQQVEVGNRQTTEVGGDPTGQVQQIQGKEVNPNTIQSNPVQNSVNQSVRTQKGLEDLFRGYFNVQGQLANNPYGKGFATSLEGMYKAQKPEYKEYGDKLYRITPEGAEIVANTGKTKRDVINTSRRVIKEGEDYFAQYDVVITDADGTQKIEKLATKLDPTVGEDEYNFQNENRFMGFKERLEAKNDANISLKMSLGDLGLLGSKGKGNKSGDAKLEGLDKVTSQKLSSYMKNTSLVDTLYGGDIDKAPKSVVQAIDEAYDYLQSQNFSDAELKDYKKRFLNGDPIPTSDIKKTIRENKIDKYEVVFNGKSYNIIKGAEGSALSKAIKDAIAKGLISVDELMAKFNVAFADAPPQIMKLIKDYLK